MLPNRPDNCWRQVSFICSSHHYTSRDQQELGTLPQSVLQYHMHPIGLVIMPTKGLACNIVSLGSSHLLLNGWIDDLPRLRNWAFLMFLHLHTATTQLPKLTKLVENWLQESRNASWNIICIDSEHLCHFNWHEITEWPIFWSDISFGCVDETYLINEWGHLFWLDYNLVSSFFHGCLPPGICVIGLTATLTSGADTSCVINSFKMVPEATHLLHQSNEWPNMELMIKKLTHGLGGYEFPCLIPFFNSGCKTTIHCSSPSNKIIYNCVSSDIVHIFVISAVILCISLCV